MIHRRTIIRATVAGATINALPSSWSQSPAGYPARPIKLLVPYSPGTTSDTIVRRVGQKLRERLGQLVTVENRPGANGSVGTSEGAKAAPDGYTLTLGLHGSMLMNPYLYKNLPYKVSDFVPVAGLIRASFLLVASLSFPADSAQQFIARARGEADGIHCGTYGAGSSGHLAAALLNTRVGTRLNSVHYSTPPIMDVVNGVLPLSFEPFTLASPYIKTQRVKTLAVTSLERNAEYPDVPSLAEVVPGFEIAPWYGLFAPKGTPPAITHLLSREIVGILRTEDVRSTIASTGSVALPLESEPFAQLVRAEMDAAPLLVAAAHLVPA